MLLHCWPAGYRCVAGSLPLSDALLPLAPLASRLQVRCQLSTSHRRASPTFTTGQPATGVLQALYLPPTRFSLFHHWPTGYRCVASSLPLTDALLPLAPLASRLQVRCQLSTTLRRASPSRTTGQPATGALPTLCLSDTLLPLAPLASRLQVRCLLSTSLRRASRFTAASHPTPGSLPALHLFPTRISLLHS